MSHADRIGCTPRPELPCRWGRVGEVDDIASAYLSCVTQTCGTGAGITVDGGAVLV